MWKCNHCDKEYNFEKTSEKANHSRWCEKNPKRNDTDNLKRSQQLNVEKKLGKLKIYKVCCYNCNIVFDVEEREKQYPTKNRYFCCKSCANSEGGKAYSKLREEKNELNYRTIAEKYHKKECVVCGFNKIVEVHHINESHKDNSPNNLIWLCPNHHQMYHSTFKVEIQPYIDKYLGI